MRVKVLLTFPKDLTDQPVTYRLIKDFDLEINILRASIDYNVEGKLLLELKGSEENIHKSIAYVKDQGINVELFDKKVIRNQEACVHCGACTAVCGADALYLNKDSWMIQFEDEKCLSCGLCVKACPLRIIEVAI
ncbi:MAG: NIL domain-containing protein [Bacillota bacterium]